MMRVFPDTAEAADAVFSVGAPDENDIAEALNENEVN